MLRCQKIEITHHRPRVREGFDKRFRECFMALIVAIRVSGFNYLQIEISLSLRERGSPQVDVD